MPLRPCDPPELIIKEDSNSLIEEALSFLLIDDVAMNRSMLSRRIKRGIAPNATITEASTGNDMDDLFKEAGSDWVWGKPMPSNVTTVKQLRTALARRKMRKGAGELDNSSNNET
eukprot:8612659-Ditylum_brightwellii.AAC.1